MKTNRTNSRNLSLLALTILVLSFAGVSEAAAKVRVNATLRTPYGAVRIGNGHGSRHVVPRRMVEVRLTKQDKRMARRLARYTGVSKREILRLRRQGYRWVEIGRWLDVSRQAVRAAKHQRSWERFLKVEQRYERCGYGVNGRVTRHKIR